MRILIVNPNTSKDFTNSIQEVAERYKRAETQVKSISPNIGPRTIECKYEQLLSSQHTLDVIITNEGSYDGLIIACYGDHPVTYAAREISTCPVIGITEASFYTACLLGDSFSVVTTDDRWEPLMWQAVRRFGLENKCSSIRTTGLPVHEFEAADDKKTYQIIHKMSKDAIEQDGAEVICLGCAGMADMDKKLQKDLGIPVVDGVASALKLMEALLEYGVNTSKRRVYAPPPAKQLTNMAAIFLKPQAK